MSTVNKKVVSTYTEVKLEGQGKLQLTKNLLDQIDHLHDVVGGIEWSGILVFKILEGSIEDHKNLVIEVDEILPMDVGTSGYTEYEISPESDDYTFDNVSRVMMDDDLKIGHIHTHHTMPTFFSGTDTQELHDNAPNHNYYLSLIVNFKDPDSWMAKIAFIGEDEIKSTIVSKYKGTTGGIVESTREVTNTRKVLYTIDMEIEAEEYELDVTEEFYARVEELNKDKGRTYTPGAYAGHAAGAALNDASAVDTSKALGGSKNWFQDKDGIWKKKPKTPVALGKQADLFSNKAAGVDRGSVKIDISSLSIRNFASKIVKQDTNTTEILAVALGQMQRSLAKEDMEGDADVAVAIYLDNIADNFDLMFIEHFKTSPCDESRELVSKKVIDLLKQYHYEISEKIAEELDLNYIMSY